MPIMGQLMEIRDAIEWVKEETRLPVKVMISLIVSNHNGSTTIGVCLKAYTYRDIDN